MPEIAQTADHALRILEELGRGEPLALPEISARLDLSKTVAHRLLVTLAARGFVLRQGSFYQPGGALLRISRALEPDLRAAAVTVMRPLSKEVGETVVLHLLDHLHAVVVDQLVGTGHVVQVSHQIGSRHPLALGASGRAILAHCDAATLGRVLGQSDSELASTLKEVRRTGFAISHDELQDGVHGIAVPVIDGQHAVGSLALLAPASRAGSLLDHAPSLLAAGDSMRVALGSDREVHVRPVTRKDA
jgi:IclR family KDG regulon transcriptional repressor